jgi:hypothetical protein
VQASRANLREITMVQEVAAEVITMAASSEGGRALLSDLVESGAIYRLMDAPDASTRAAAASAVTKLGLAAKVRIPRRDQLSLVES